MVTCRPLLVGVALSALAVCAAAVTPRDRATAAADSLWATFWSAEEQYLLRDAPAAQSSSSTTTGSLLPYWNFQEATHAVAAAAGLDYAKYGPRLRSMIQGQAVMTPSRQPGTGTGPGPSGADGWTRPGLDEMNWAVLALIAAHDAAEAANDTAAAAMYLNGATNRYPPPRPGVMLVDGVAAPPSTLPAAPCSICPRADGGGCAGEC